MLDSLFTTIKNLDLNKTAKTKSQEIYIGFINVKQRFIRKCTPNKPPRNKINCSKVSACDYADHFENMSLPPRAFDMSVLMDDSYLTNLNMEWIPFMPSYDEQNLVDRFLKVVTIDDDNNEPCMDREEIRKRLAMGSDDYYVEKFSQKPGFQEKMHSDTSLRICFMNETVSDTDSPNSNSESPDDDFIQMKPTFKLSQNEKVRPTTLNIPRQSQSETETDGDFFTKQAKLQTEARMALAQAKEMARMQMQIERQLQKKSPIADLIRRSLEKIGIPFPEDKRRLSRQILTEMNIAQLQVIVNDLHSQIETLNEVLVGHLMDRDDLHMEQDSMLVDIEDLTKYLDAKEQLKARQPESLIQNNNSASTPTSPSSLPLSGLNCNVKADIHKIVSLVKKM